MSSSSSSCFRRETVTAGSDDLLLHKCRKEARARLDAGPLPESYLDQLVVFKLRVSRKVQKGQNGALWKPIQKETRALVDWYLEHKNSDDGDKKNSDPHVNGYNNKNKNNPLRALLYSPSASRKARKIVNECFDEFPECVLWTRDDVMVTEYRQRRPNGESGARSEFVLTQRALDIATRMKLLVHDGGDEKGGGIAESKELLDAGSTQFVNDVFMLVKCCREHELLKRALQNAYQLLGSSVLNLSQSTNKNKKKNLTEDGHDEQNTSVPDDSVSTALAAAQKQEEGALADMSLTAGSLLASYRELGSFFIPQDSDVDLLIRPEDEARAHRLLKMFSPESQRVRRAAEKRQKGDFVGNAFDDLANDPNELLNEEQISKGMKRRLPIPAAGNRNKQENNGDGAISAVRRHEIDVKVARLLMQARDAVFGGKITTKALEPPNDHAHGRLIGYVYGTHELSHHEESPRAEIWIQQESRKMQKAALVYPTRRCVLQDVDVRCPAEGEKVLVAGYGDKWNVPCKVKASNCKS